MAFGTPPPMTVKQNPIDFVAAAAFAWAACLRRPPALALLAGAGIRLLGDLVFWADLYSHVKEI